MTRNSNTTPLLKETIKSALNRLICVVLAVNCVLVCTGLFLFNRRLSAIDAGITVADLLINVLVFVLIMTAVLVYASGFIMARIKDYKPKDPARDELTGIRNVVAYAEEVKRLDSDLKEGNLELGVALIDLRGLKKINEECGMPKGDEAIKTLCFIVCHVFEHSPVFRLNGDQFVVILKNIDLQNIDFLLESFAEKLAKLKEDDSLKPWEKVNAAIGVAFYDPDQDTTVENVLKRAEKAMYDSKDA
ncbi:MAG: GGDEF domain-containing protein [Lachnospiraceae bacterium]|nr:GGDEF domain-containing protein [Lachnospiraceae bacterium]